MRKIIFVAICFLPLYAKANKSLGYINFGPMVHWNFKPSNSKLSYGFEISAWFLGDKYDDLGVPSGDVLGYGLDFGFDIGKGLYRIYCEPQIEWKWSGISVGPVTELKGRFDLPYSISCESIG